MGHKLVPSQNCIKKAITKFENGKRLDPNSPHFKLEDLHCTTHGHYASVSVGPVPSHFSNDNQRVIV